MAIRVWDHLFASTLLRPQELKAKGLPQRCFATKTKYQTEPAKTGFTIIDTTDVSQAGEAGHSDYLRSFAVCKDFAAVVNGARTAPMDRTATQGCACLHGCRIAPVKPTKEDIGSYACKMVARLMSNETRLLKQFKQVLTGTARALAQEPEVELAFTADAPSQAGKNFQGADAGSPAAARPSRRSARFCRQFCAKV